MTELFQNLENLPRLNQSHQWADYVELLALVSADKFYSQGYLQDTEGENEDVALDIEDVDDDFELDSGHADDKLNRRWSDIKTCLNSRYHRFTDAWPFELKDDVLYAKEDTENPLHRLYIALLLASTLRYIHNKRRTEITNSLEEIAYQLFCQLMPQKWTVKPFGAHHPDGYRGTLFEKISQLATDLNSKVLAEKEDFKKGNSGDGGLDLVAWHSLGDNLGYIPSAFAQCGCSLDDVEHKQFEAHPANWSNKIQLHHPPANYYFSPHDFRQNSGHWDAQLGEVIMIDRSRILYLAKLYQLPRTSLTWFHVDEAITSNLLI